MRALTLCIGLVVSLALSAQQTPLVLIQSIELPGGIVTPGWSNPNTEKLPFFGLPEEMHGLRVLDVGHAEGFFSFEAERRGATEVVGIETYPPMIQV